MAAGKLKNIRLKPLNIMVLNMQHGQIPSRVLVKWEIEPSAQDLKDLYFYVDRGESPEELNQLQSMADGVPAHQLYEFVDFTANLTDLNKVYYYRVRAVEFFDGTPVQTFSSEPVTWDGNLDLVGLYVVEEHLFLHRWVSGVPTMIFKRRLDGQYCPNCWDKILKRVTISNCTTCYGTGKLNGFYPPYEGWVDFEPDPKVVQVSEMGKRQVSQTDIQYTNYPLLTDGDLIVELNTNRYWKVSTVRYPEKNRTIMLQVARVDSVSPSDVEYRIPISEERRVALLALLDERSKEREF
jgi:hypothetical protein